MKHLGWRVLAAAILAGLVPACGGGGGGGGGGGTVIVNPPPTGNSPPGVALVSPSPGATVITGSALVVEASVTDSDGFVTRVEFFDGSALIGTATAFPFRISWTAPAPGTASLTAVATDNAGASTSSSPVPITIAPAGNTPPPLNIAPTVAISSPSEGSVFPLGTAIDVQVFANDSDGTVTLVELFEGSHQIGSATQSPVHITWTPAQPGIYSLRAIATDDDGASVSSDPVTITIESSSSSSSRGGIPLDSGVTDDRFFGTCFVDARTEWVVGNPEVQARSTRTPAGRWRS